jgi:hypothetical protein
MAKEVQKEFPFMAPEAPPAPKAEPKKDNAFSAEYVKDLREENKRRRIEARQLAQEVDALNARSRGLALKSAFFDEAAKAGVTHLEDAYRLADMGKVEIDQSTDTVKGVGEAIETLRRDKPYLFKRPKPQPFGSEAALAGSAPSPLDAARDAAMKSPSIKNVARYQAELARAKQKPAR